MIGAERPRLVSTQWSRPGSLRLVLVTRQSRSCMGKGQYSRKEWERRSAAGAAPATAPVPGGATRWCWLRGGGRGVWEGHQEGRDMVELFECDYDVCTAWML